MECDAARERLVDLLDEKGDPELRRVLEEHVAGCPTCRAELQLLKQAQAALLGSVEELAPARTYLSPARLRRLHRALAIRSYPFPSFRVLVASASIAAILVAGFFIYQSAAALLKPSVPPRQGSPPLFGQAGSETGFQPVHIGLASSPQQDGLHIVVGYAQPVDGPRGAWSQRQDATQQGRLLLTSSPGVDVPVENVLYDSEQAGYWW